MKTNSACIRLCTFRYHTKFMGNLKNVKLIMTLSLIANEGNGSEEKQRCELEETEIQRFVMAF